VTVKPNLFVVGAMKCGTTILCDFLAMHPEINVAPAKELHYFSLLIDKGEDWYLKQFPEDLHAKYLVDASPTYLDTCNSLLLPKLIKSFSPDSKVIIMIRDPVERIVSHFNHLKNVAGIETVAEKTVADLLHRDWTEAIAGVGADAFVLNQLLGFSAYYQKIINFATIFGAGNVLVLNNADLRKSGQAVMSRTFNFLDLPDLSSSSFSEQRYLGDTNTSAITLKQEINLYKMYSADYVASSTYTGVSRFTALSPAHSNVPAGALVGEVGIGLDGWLFLAGGSNSVLDFFVDGPEASASLVRQWIDLVEHRRRLLNGEQITYLHVFVPEKLSVYDHMIPWNIDPRHSPGSLFSDQSASIEGRTTLDLFSIFREKRDEIQLYFKTDSHWNHAGAYLAYQEICRHLGVSIEPHLLDRESHSGSLVFDLGSKLPGTPAEECRFYQFVSNARLVEENELVRLKRSTGRLNDAGLHVGSYVRYVNESASSSKKVMLFGDSFSEYREHLLTGLLAETFAEFSFVWSTSLDIDLIRQVRPDIVLSVMTERFMRRVPDDSFSLTSYVARVMREE
jgi:alginate O-acetyltransferase complex protein AlgJ